MVLGVEGITDDPLFGPRLTEDFRRNGVGTVTRRVGSVCSRNYQGSGT